MNSYFDQVQHQIAGAVAGGKHLPWRARVRRAGRTRPLAVVIAALLVATPAVGAVTHWFGFGAPLYFQPNSPTQGSGRGVASTSVLLRLRVADPQGGPPWGLRLVHTTRGDVCLQFGRVEDGRLGSLGIDGAWNNDRLFHPFPNAFDGGWGLQCGTTDAAGHAFINVQWTGIASSANPFQATSGPNTGGCEAPQYMPSSLRQPEKRHLGAAGAIPLDAGTCPRGASRMVFMGLLGPDATSITYQAPNGSVRHERTSGTDGAYLLVVPLTQNTCNLYFQGPEGAQGPCGDSVSGGGSNNESPGPFGPVRAIQYRDGHTCTLEPSRTLLASYRAVVRPAFPARYRNTPMSRKQLDHLQRDVAQIAAQFAEANHLTMAELRDKLRPICPAVGYVAPLEKHLTEADVASSITIGPITRSGMSAGAQISFIARQPVTSDDSWYEFATTGPARCQANANGPIGNGNIHVGQRLTEQIGVSPNCKGTIHGVIAYMQHSGPTDAESAGDDGTPGKDGSIIVGRFTFTMP